MGQRDAEHMEAADNPGVGLATKPRRASPRPRMLPPWRVLLHNDDVNDMLYVANAIIELTTLDRQAAVLRMLEAHQNGLSQLLTTHREHAKLLQEQFQSKRVTVTIEPLS